MSRVTLVDGRTFSVGAAQLILDAAAAAGMTLAYSCRTGRCSTCRARVIEGATAALVAETGLSPVLADAGWVLTCARTAVGDVKLDLEVLDGPTLPAPRILPSRIGALELLAPDVLRVTLRLPPSAEFDYRPGQYVDVIGPGGVRRSYSLASDRRPDGMLELHIRAVPGGALSEYWFRQAQANDLLRIVGPYGTFFLRNVGDLDLCFLATGTGIAPVKAMLESVAREFPGGKPRSVTVLWGGRGRPDLYWPIQEIPGEFSFVPVLSRPDDAWDGAVGHVQDVLLTRMPDMRNAAVYACGSPAMIESARLLLAGAGLAVDRFFADAFVTSGSTNDGDGAR